MISQTGQMDLARIITIYVVYLGMAIFNMFLIFLVLRRDTKKLNKIFCGFYLCSAIGLIINVIYAPLEVNPLVLILHFITYYLFCLAFCFLLIFNLILLKSEKILTSKKQLIIFVVYSALLMALVFIPNGIVIDDTTGWKPTYSLIFFIYAISIVSCIGIIPIVHYSIEIYKTFEDKIIRKRWKMYFIGMFIYFVVFYLTSISNYLNIQSFRVFISIISLLLFGAIVLVYLGVGRQLAK
ncbi:MAG TPA: hypothetical protein VGB37_12995 [Candidatus Lokiarchaeia archaeon]